MPEGHTPQALELGAEVRLGTALRQVREQQRLSLRALARRLHRSHSTLVEYERGHRLATLEVVEAYELELGITPGTLVTLHEQARLELYGADRSRRLTYVLRPTLHAPHQLPRDIAAFTGRDAELAALRALAAGGTPKTVAISAICGTPGVGKTALAIHLAHELLPDFPDLQLYVDLHGYEPLQHLAPAQVLDRFLRALGVPADELPTDLDEQAARYRSLLAGRRALVVLDNASSAEQVRPLLPASPSCFVLVTSRDRLAGMVTAEGAQAVILDVLSMEKALELLARTAGAERVNREPEAAAEIVRLCGLLPLAVHIAGARLAIRPTMSLVSLAERFSNERNRLGELSVGDVGVRASFASSYAALDPEASRMFRRLGLIPGADFTRGVAAALVSADPEDAEGLLEALVDAHLVEVTSAFDRYRFHDLLRLYARERVQADEIGRDRDSALRRMFRWYLDSADSAGQFLIPGRKRLLYQGAGRSHKLVFTSLDQALAWFDAECANILAAGRKAANAGYHSFTWQIADALRGFFSLRSHWADWRDTHRIGLAAAREAQDRRAEAWMLTSLGHLYSELNQFDKSIHLRERSLAIFRELGDPEGEARALSALGSDYLNLRRLEQGMNCQMEALAICRRTKDRYREGLVLQLLGEGYRSLDRFEEGIDCFQQALSIRQELDERWYEGTTLRCLGELYGDLRQFEEAIDCFHRAQAIAREVGHRWGEGYSLLLLGVAFQEIQDREAAHDCWRQALAIFTDLGAPETKDVRTRLGEPEAIF